jgi:tetratricopeptide (TPR) repeat protein
LRTFKTRHNLATILEEMGEAVKAEEQWRAVVREAPRYRAGWHGLAGLLLKAGKLNAAEELLAQMEADPKLGAEAAILSAHIALELKNVAEARRVLESATGRFPRDTELLRTTARILFEQVNAVDAEPVLHALLNLEPDDPSTWYNLGSVRQIQRRYDEAAEAYRQALARRPACAATHTALGNALQNAGRAEEAAQAWEQAIRIRPDYSAAITALRQVGRLRS